MQIDLEVLDRYGACKEGVDFIRRKYPQGVEVSEIANDPELPREFFYWAWSYLPLNPDELELYNQKMELTGCSRVYKSYHCKNSHGIISSEDIVNSENVGYSRRITDSANIKHSTMVGKSQHITECKNIDSSSYCFDSADIQKSHIIYNSNFVSNSIGAFKSLIIQSCVGVQDCHKLTNSMFCARVDNSENCLFCADLDNAKNMVFNEPCDPQFIEMFRNAIDAEFVPKILQAHRGRVNPNAPEARYYFFHSLDTEFWEWVKNLPGYNPDLLFNTSYHLETK